MDKNKIIKISGIAVSVFGMGLSVLTGILDDKKLDAKIAKHINESLKK